MPRLLVVLADPSAVIENISLLGPNGLEMVVYVEETHEADAVAAWRSPEWMGAHLKSAFRYAMDQAFDFVIQLEGPFHASSVTIDRMMQPCLANSSVDCVIAASNRSSLTERLMGRSLSSIQARLTHHPLRHWYGLNRVYRVSALGRIAFELNTDEQHFNTEILQQMLHAGSAIEEIPAISPAPAAESFFTWTYAWNSLKAGMKYRLQSVHLFYDFRYHPELVFSDAAHRRVHTDYHSKFLSDSPHAFVLSNERLIRPGSRVLDIGCSTGYVADHLAIKKSCRVTGIDLLPPEDIQSKNFDYHRVDLEKDMPALLALLEKGPYDYIIMLDVLEHLAVPELFLLQLYRHPGCRNAIFIFSTGNVAFAVIRLMLFLGYFNYGQKGILDITHKRLFSVRTFKNLLDQTGFHSHERICFPLPYRELGLSERLCRVLESIHHVFLWLRPSLFAYQVLFVASSSAHHAHRAVQRGRDAESADRRQKTAAAR